MANLNGRMSCIKYGLFSTNFIFVLMGVLVLTTGVVLLTIYNNFELFLESHHFKPAEIMIAVGAIIFFVSFIGCIGAIKESTMMVNLYALLLFLIIILEIAGGLTAFIMRCDIADDIRENMIDSLKDYNKSESSKEAWDFTQKHMHCCGVDYPHNWAPEHIDGQLVTIGGESFTVPYSCCTNEVKFCDDIYREGCSKAMGSYISNSSAAIGFLAIAVGVLQSIGVLIAVILAKAIRRVKTEQEMERQQTLNTSTLFLPNSSSTDA